MAKKKRGSSDYSAGNGKRWSVILGIIVLVAIIVVVIIIAIPPNTYNAVETLNRASKTNYLSSATEQTAFDKFEEKMTSSVYLQEVQDIEKMSKSVDIILDYYNDYLVFAKDNKTFKNNYKTIKENLEEAKENQKKMSSIISKTTKLSDVSSTYLQNSMIDFRRAYVKYLKNCKSAIGGLENVYAGSLGNVTFNNTASKLILNTVNDYISVIVSNFGSLAKADVKDGSTSGYAEKYQELALTKKIDYFNDFLLTYLSDSNHDIETYYFQTSVQEKYSLLNEFFTLYSQKNLKGVINSIQASGTIAFVAPDEVVDTNGAFAGVVNFIGGIA